MADDDVTDGEEQAVARSRKGAATRARLLEAAKLVFEEDGFLDARITDIAERAGLSHGSFYHYFDSKEQVFREVAAEQSRFMTDFGEPGGQRDPDETPRERIRRSNRSYLERFREGARFLGVVEQMSRYDEELAASRRRQHTDFAERYGKVIRRYQDEGLVARALDPELTAMALAGMVTRFAELWFVQGYADYEYEHAVDQLTRLWAGALGLPDEPEPDPGRPTRGRRRTP